MPSSPTSIRNGIKGRLALINGLKIYSRWPSNIIEFPCAIITRIPSEPAQTFGLGNLTRWDFDVYLLASLAPGYDAAQDTLDPFLAVNATSTGNVYGAIRSDPTLGGAAWATFVIGVREDDQIDLGGTISALGAVVEIQAWAE